MAGGWQRQRAKGGGKSWFLCVWIVYWVNKLIRQFGLQETDTPLALGFIGRKRAVDFYSTTFETFKRNVPKDIYTINEIKKEIIFWRRAKVRFGGLDNQEDIEKFNSAEYAFIAIDQAEETERTDVAVLQAALRLTHNGITPPYKELYTANPGDCWLKTDFVDGQRKDGIFVPALPSENPYLPKDYIHTLEQAFQHDPELLLAYRDGNWDIMQKAKVVFSRTMLADLEGVTLIEPRLKKFVSIDPATGGDECVMMAWENTKVVKMEMSHSDDPMKVAGELLVFAKQHGCRIVGGDCIGLGHGILTRVRELEPEWQVILINSAEKAKRNESFKTVRSELWFEARELVLAKKVAAISDEETIRQLCSPRFSIVDSNGRTQVERKDITKARLGRSPDRADCWIYGIHLYRHTVDRPETSFVKDYGRGNKESLGYMSA